MNGTEYQIWLGEHLKRFPSVKTWLDKNQFQSQLWAETLANTPYEDALAVSHAWAVGAEGKPIGHGEHARAIKDEAKALAAESPRSGTVACNLCFDTGSVAVWNPQLVGQLINRWGYDIPLDWARTEYVQKLYQDRVIVGSQMVSASCNCEMGVRMSTRMVDHKEIQSNLVYDDLKMCLIADPRESELGSRDSLAKELGNVLEGRGDITGMMADGANRWIRKHGYQGIVFKPMGFPRLRVEKPEYAGDFDEWNES